MHARTFQASKSSNLPRDQEDNGATKIQGGEAKGTCAPTKQTRMGASPCLSLLSLTALYSSCGGLALCSCALAVSRAVCVSARTQERK